MPKHLGTEYHTSKYTGRDEGFWKVANSHCMSVRIHIQSVSKTLAAISGSMILVSGHAQIFSLH